MNPVEPAASDLCRHRTISPMTFRIVDTGWASELTSGLNCDRTVLRAICPFIKRRTLDRILSSRPRSIQVITRYNLSEFADGVSDIEALRSLLDVGAAVRGIRNLHAKLYIFGSSRAIVTSANLTEAGVNRNHEFGAVTEDAGAIEHCNAYFDNLWRRGGSDLQHELLDEWDRKVVSHLLSGGRLGRSSGFGDFGADAGIARTSGVEIPQIFADAPQAFVKLLGRSGNRVPVSFPVFDELRRAGCHWTVAYPASKRPRRVRDGAVMFIGRLTDERDIRIFGRAIGIAHEPGRDDATLEDIAQLPWKQDWPHYIRVHHAEFVHGTIGNGVSLNVLMDSLGADSFMPTQRNAAAASGNLDPRRAYMRQADVELSNEGYAWLNERLQTAFHDHGTVPHDRLAELYWPDRPLPGRSTRAAGSSSW